MLQFVQCQIGGDDQRQITAQSGINDIEYLLQRIFRAALHAQIVDDQQAVMVKTVDVLVSVIGEHPGQRIQNAGKVGH